MDWFFGILLAQNHETDQHSMIALVGGMDFKDGTIEVEVAGLPILAMEGLLSARSVAVMRDRCGSAIEVEGPS